MKLLQKLILIPGIIGMGFGLFDKAYPQFKKNEGIKIILFFPDFIKIF